MNNNILSEVVIWDAIKILVFGFFGLLFVFTIVFGTYRNIRDNNIVREVMKADKETLSEEQYCNKYFGEELLDTVPAYCIKYFTK